MSKFTLINELIRKSIHMLFIVYVFLIDRVPIRVLQLSLVILGICYYLLEELRLRKIYIPYLSNITRFVLREKEVTIIAFAPLTLMLGFVLVLEIYAPLYAKIAFIATTLGDSIAAIMGTLFPTPKVFWNKKKSFVGTIFNIIAVLAWCLFLPVPVHLAVIVGIVSGLIESLQLEHVDNLMIPLSVGAVPYFVM